jgi:DNA-binding response OmpR family regulator
VFCLPAGRSGVVLLAALGQQDDRRRSELAGADAYVVKPFSPLALVELVKALPGAGAAMDRS